MNKQTITSVINAKGNAIILSLPLTVVVIGVIQLALLQSSNFNGAITSFRATGGRDSLVANIRMYSSLPSTFRSSLHPSHISSINTELQNCVFGGSLPCNAGVEIPVTLFSPMSSTSASPSSELQMIAGPVTSGSANSQAALYDMMGNHCAEAGSASERCPYEVTASFVATCAGGASSCATAQSIAVHYFIQYVHNSNSQKFPLRKLTEQFASSVTVASILPPSTGSSSGNITVSSLTSVSSGSAALLAQFSELIKSLVPYATDADIAAAAQAFVDAGYTNTDLVSQLVPVLATKENRIELIKSLGSLNITDATTALMLAKAGISDTTWIQKVLDAGITDPFYAENMYYHRDSYQTAADVKLAYEAVKRLPANIATVLVSTITSDPVVAKNVYNQVFSYTQDTEIAAYLLAGGWYKDSTKATAIVSAVSTVPSPISGSIAYLGVTDPAVAKQIYDTVSVMDDVPRAQSFISSSGGDLAYIQNEVKNYLAQPGTTSSTSTSTTTTTTANPPPATVTPPSDISLISTCSNCSGVTF